VDVRRQMVKDENRPELYLKIELVPRSKHSRLGYKKQPVNHILILSS
jgi:hypothetical protein